MQRQKLFLTLLFIALTFTVCKKKSDDNSPTATCSDGIQNQGETDIDCGGPCTSCMTWIARNKGLTDLTVFQLVVNGTTIFALTINGNIFKSTDNGNNWSPNNTSFNLYTLTASGGNLFASAEGGKMYKSTDNGSSWSSLTDVPTISNINSIAVSAPYIYVVSYGGAGKDTVYLSTDNGVTWGATNLIGGSINLTVGGTKIFASKGNTPSIYKTDVGGNTWTNCNAPIGISAISCIAANGDNIVAGGFHGILSSTDYGNAWWYTGTSSYDQITSVITNGSSIFAASNVYTNDLLLSTNNGVNWTFKIDGLNSQAKVYSVVFVGTSAFAATDYGIYKRQL